MTELSSREAQILQLLRPASDLVACADLLDHLPVILRNYRRDRNLTLRAASKQSGIPFSTIRRIEENGKTQTDIAVQLLRWMAGRARRD